MSNNEKLTQKLSCYGRLVDEITREVIPFKHFTVSIEGFKSRPNYKEDGYFAFSDLEPALADYQFHLSSRFYQSRIIRKNLSTGSPLELTYPGEDELYVAINNVEDGTYKKVTFDSIPFVKTIPEGAEIKGENEFSTRLARTLEGENIDFAILENISGLNAGEILRFVRSRNIIMRPAPYYSFEPEATLIVLKFVENTSPDILPVAGVKCEIERANDVSIDEIPVDSLVVKTVDITTPVTAKLVLGTENDIITYSNERGDAIFYYPADTPIEKLSLDITAAGYNPVKEEVTVVNKQRTFNSIELTKI